MKVETDVFLRLVEKANTLAFFDIETSGLEASYGKILMLSYKFIGDKKCTSVYGSEKRILAAARKLFETADCVVGFNGRLFDATYLNTRLLELGQPPLRKVLHCDLYFKLKGSLRTHSKSLGSIGSLLGLKEDKLHAPPQTWRNRDMKMLRKRCESDVLLTEQLYKRTRHLIRDITT